MPQTDMGVLLFIGAIFFLIGLLGGGFEISAIKIPPVGKYPRYFSLGIGAIFMGIAIIRLIFPPVPLQTGVTPTVTTPAATMVIAEAKPTETPVTPKLSIPTPEPAKTPQPHTPTPTSVPTNTPTPTATIDADPTVYDNFNNPAFDGKINPELWFIDYRGNTGTAKIIQQDGTLLMSDTPDSTSDGIILKLGNWKGSRFKLFEIKVMLSGEGGENGNISINAESPDIPAGWTELGIGNRPPNNYATTGTKMNNEWVGGPDLPYNKWHKLRIEFNNQTNKFTYFVNDQLMDTRHLSTSNETSFKPVIQLWHEKGTSVKGFVDEVRIE